MVVCADAVEDSDKELDVWVNQKVLHDNAWGGWYLGCAGSALLHQPSPSAVGSARV